MRRVGSVWILVALMTSGFLRGASANVGLEYIGHACFVVTSPSGLRVVIDPFNSERWLGYRFPESVKADAVLVTHPHYDHDASYYWGDSIPVFREPGDFRIGDVTVRGIEGRHADPYGNDFEQKNTIFVLETGGLRIAHLGDNGPLSDDAARELGKVDVLLFPADGMDHILTTDQINAIRNAVQPTIAIPMHYSLKGYLDLPKSLGPIEPWLEKQSAVTRLESNVTQLSQLPDAPQLLVFQPSPDLKVWSEGLAHGWRKLGEARQLIKDNPGAKPRAAELVHETYGSADNIVFAFQWARVLSETGRTDEAIEVLERGLANAGRQDWEYRMRSRCLLGEIYVKKDRKEDAAEQYRVVLNNSRRTELLAKAREFLESYYRDSSAP